MKVLKFFLAILVCFMCFNAYTASILSPKEKSFLTTLKITTFPDYFPFGEIFTPKERNATLKSIFTPALEVALPKTEYSFSFQVFSNVENAVAAVRQGDADIFLGAYYSTNLYDGLEYIFPAVLNNPIHLMTLPEKITEIKSIQDLKNFKGVYIQSEHFSDYMLNNFQNIGLKTVETPDDAYKALLTGEIDFILGSYYFGYAEILKRGLKPYIAFSTTPLWNMPMFIAVSKTKTNPKANLVQALLRKFVPTDKFKNTLIDTLKQTIEDLEIQSQGIVPPTYVREGVENELTPADEIKGEN